MDTWCRIGKSGRVAWPRDCVSEATEEAAAAQEVLLASAHELKQLGGLLRDKDEE